MPKHKSISMKLNGAGSIEVKQKILSDWSKGWENDQNDLLQLIHYAAIHNNLNDVLKYTGQLKGVTDKRFVGLNNVLHSLTEQLKDNDSIKVIKDDAVDDVPPEPVQPEIKEQSKDETNPDRDFIKELVAGYNAGMSLREMSAYNGINYKKIIKILITEGVYSSDIYDRIKELRERGKTEQEVADAMCMTLKQLNDYTPYKKGLHNAAAPTENALRIKRSRSKCS